MQSAQSFRSSQSLHANKYPVAAMNTMLLVQDQPQNSFAEFEALLVGYLSLCDFNADGRWITLVADKSVSFQRYKPILHQYQRIRIIQSESEDLLWLTWQCLAQGNSQAVITIAADVSSGDKQHLLNAAEIGHCCLHLINTNKY